MHLKTLAILLITANSAQAEFAWDTYPKNPDVDIIHYTFQLTLSDETDEIRGNTTVEVRFKKAGLTQLRLDLIKTMADGRGMAVSSVTADGQPVDYVHESEALFISLPVPFEAHQALRFTIGYHGVPATGLLIAPNKHGDRTFFSDNWPNRTRHWLPTLDHPSDKATCEFIITAPNHYQVVSNGLLLEESDLDAQTRRTHWRQSVPIATWLYALAVARFAVQYVDTFDGKSIQTWVYPQDRDAGFYDFAVPTRHTLEFYSDYVGPFAYEKLANIQSNSVGGGMEAATAIFYGDRSVTGARTERWRNVIIHEVAHQWFGNAVTESDWDDVWLSEGFATYFTLLFIEHAYGRDEFVQGLKDSQRRVNDFYAENPDYRIVHDNLDDMSKVTTSQTYQKGSWVLHMLRGLIGDEAFWKGIRSYYARYMNGNATTDDFRREMETASGRELNWFFDQWLYKGGTLKLKGEWTYEDQTVRLNLAQVQNDGYLFRMPVQVGIYFEGNPDPHIETIELSTESESYTIPVEQEPERIVLDPDTWVLLEAEIDHRN